MKHTTYQGRQYVVSRSRGGTPHQVELVDLETGELVVVRAEELGQVTQVYLDCVPNLIHFPARPRSFLSELRVRREAFLKEARLRKRRAGPKVEKSPRGSEPRVRARKVSPRLAAAMAHLPPEVQALLIKAGRK